MSYLKDMFTLAKHEDKISTPEGNVISVGSEETMATVTSSITDDGTFLQFQAYWADIKTEIVDNDHLTQEMYFCALIKLGLLQKRGSAYLPPEEIYEKMKGKKGIAVSSFYRKKSNAKGISFGFDYENVGSLNSQHKPAIVDLLQSLEDDLDDALDEAKEFGKFMKEKHRNDPTKSGKATTWNRVRAIFDVSKRELMHKHLGC